MGGYRTPSDRSLSVRNDRSHFRMFGLPTSALPEQRPSRLSLWRVIADLRLRRPFEGHRSDPRAAVSPARSRGARCRLPVSAEPQGAHVTVAGDRPGPFPRRRDRDDLRSSKKGFAHNAEIIGGYASRIESDDTSHGVRRPFGEMSSGDRYGGLPHRHHPLSGFFTLSAVWSRLDRVVLFRTTSARRIFFGLQSFSRSASSITSR